MKFKELYKVPSRNGLTKPSAIRGAGIKFCNMGELFANSRIGDIPMELVPVTEREMAEALLEEGDLLFARQSLVREGAGKCSVVTRIAEPTTFDSHLIRVRLNQEIANPLFYQYYFSSHLSPIPAIITQCAQSGIRGKELAELDVLYLPIERQNVIAEALSRFDSLIDNNRKQIKLLEEAAQRLYKEWFIDLRFPGHETAKINPETELPEGWARKRLDQIADFISRGVTPKYDSESSWTVLGQTCIRNNLVLLENARHLHPIASREKLLRSGDLLINSTGVGSLGRTAQIWFEPNEMTVDSHVTIVRDSSRLYSHYLSIWAFSNEAFIESLHSGSTGQTELSRDRLASAKLLKPSSPILMKFNAFVEPISTAINEKQKSIADLCEARDRLLPKLMSGELEI